jgi:hypothetical protein
MKGLNKDKIIVKVRGSTNGISNKYSINSFYYSTGNHTQRRFDVTILFDSFTHIYLMFYPCFIYKMS